MKGEKWSNSKRRNGKFTLELIDEATIIFDLSREIIDSVCIFMESLFWTSPKKEQIAANNKEKKEEEQSMKIAYLRYEQEKNSEYQKVRQMIETQDIQSFTYDFFNKMLTKCTRTFKTNVNGREIEIEPSFDGSQHKIAAAGHIVKISVREVLSYVKYHKKMTDTKVESELQKKENHKQRQL